MINNNLIERKINNILGEFQQHCLIYHLDRPEQVSIGELLESDKKILLGFDYDSTGHIKINVDIKAESHIKNQEHRNQLAIIFKKNGYFSKVSKETKREKQAAPIVKEKYKGFFIC